VPTNRVIPELDAIMPLYLSEELSPRFSRAKATSGFNERRQVEAEAREEVGRVAVEDWEAGGRDKGLERVLESDEVGLEGVSVRGRTRKEVRQAAIEAFDEQLERVRKEVKAARREGKVYDWSAEGGVNSAKATGEVVAVGDGWLQGEKGRKVEVSRARKERKERRTLAKLENLRLEEGRNMVVPKDVRA
jgi:large subunit ribosomal protein L24